MRYGFYPPAFAGRLPSVTVTVRFVAAVHEAELDVVARLLLVDGVDHVVHAGDRLAVDRGDHVAARPELLARDGDGRVAAP